MIRIACGMTIRVITCHRLQPCANDLRHVGGFVEGERERPGHDCISGDWIEDRRVVEDLGGAVVDEKDLQDQRRAAKDPQVEVDGQLEEGIARHSAQRQKESEDDAGRLGDECDLDDEDRRADVRGAEQDLKEKLRIEVEVDRKRCHRGGDQPGDAARDSPSR
jgi:hypothetical protein